MPTSLPRRRRKQPDLLIVFIAALAAAFFVVELVDPAPTDVAAGFIVGP